MVNQKVSAWDVLQAHPIAQKIDIEAQLALLCEYIDLYEELEKMSLDDFITAYFAAPAQPVEPAADMARFEAAADAAAAAVIEDEEAAAEPSANGDGAKAKEPEPRPASMIGMRVVYKFPGRNVLSNEAGVTRDSTGTVAFVDVDDEPWTNVIRDKVYPIKPENHREIHVTRREAKEIEGWLNGGKQVEGQAEGTVMRSLFFEFIDHPDRIAFAIMNGKRPYVDRFVSLPDNGFDDDQKPTTRLFGEHSFRVRGVDYIVNVVTP